MRVQYPKMRIWSILFIKSDLKSCIHLKRGQFLYWTHCLAVHALVYCKYDSGPKKKKSFTSSLFFSSEGILPI